jgi:hypothetical protein
MSMHVRSVFSRFSRLSAAVFACALLPIAAKAGDSVNASQSDGYARFLFTFAPPAHGTAALNGNVLTIAFDRPVTIDLAKLQALSSVVTSARVDPDKKTFRLVLSETAKLHTSVSGASYAVDVAPTTFAGTPPDLPPPPKPPGPVDPDSLAALKIRAGIYKNFTRVVFDWPKSVPYTIARGKDSLVLHFAALGKPDFSPLTRVAPPWVKAGDWHIEANRGIAVALTVDPGSRTHDFRDGAHVVLDVLSPTADANTYTPPADPGKKAVPVVLGPKQDGAQSASIAKTDGQALTATAPPKPLTQAQAIADASAKLSGKPDTPPKPQTPPSPPPAPLPAAPPANDATAQRTRDGAVLTFANTHSAAVFVRGMTAWIVIDGAPALDPAALKKGVGDFSDSVSVATGDNAAIVRIALKTPAKISVQQKGSALQVSLGSKAEDGSSPLEFARGADPQSATLTTTLAGATHSIAITDPDAGDTMLVVPGDAGHAVLQQRDHVEFSLLPTAEGLAIVPHADDLSVSVANTQVTIRRPHGLALAGGAAVAASSPTMLTNGHDGPTFLNFAAWKRGPGQDVFTAVRALRMNIALHDPSEANSARLQLAQFYLANHFAAEALGLIKIMQTADPRLQSDPQLQTMRSAADYMMGRFRDARADLAGDSFGNDRHAALWRGLTEAALHNWGDARDAFALAEGVIHRYPAEWQVRLRLAEADAALSTGLIEAADTAVVRLPKVLPADLMLDGELIYARLYAQEGRFQDAALLFAAVEKGKNGYDAAQAVYYRTEANLISGAMTQDQAIDALENLRFRWRGDLLELATLRRLGQLYFGKQDWRDGLRVLRIATQSFPNEDAGREAQDDMRTAFDNLYLKGHADKLAPVQALALFYDNMDLTPIGPTGDEMIRRMSDRLVAVDLLGPAADLLKYQVNKRLDGVAQSQVAARLAMVYLMDKKPQQALDTLTATRISGLPDDVNHERMLLEARALAGLKRWDQALDMIAVDNNPDTSRLRADIYWDSGNWAIAGQKSEELLGTRYSDPAPLNAGDRNDVMRAAVAYSLANDQPSLDRLRTNFAPKMQASTDASAFNVVTQKIDAHGLAFRDAAAEIAGVDTLKTFLADFKKGGT